MSNRLFSPRNRGVRDPLTNEQNNGRIVNPPRYSVLGGFSSRVKGFFKNAFGIKTPKDTL